MKIVNLVARILLGLLFLVFGLNGFLQFLPMPPFSGAAAQYMGVLFQSHALAIVFVLEIAGGALLLANRFVPLALVLLGPVIVNIVIFHTLIAHADLQNAALALVLWLAVFVPNRAAFSSLLVRESS